MRWLIILLFMQALDSATSMVAQSDLIRIPCGEGFSSVRAVAGANGRWYVQGTLPDQMEWDEVLIGSGSGRDIFFAVVDPLDGLMWRSIWGGDGVERIRSKPVISPDGEDWFFYGDAIDSMQLGTFSYRPSLSSFFSFTGIQSAAGELKKVRALESSGPLEITAAAWGDRKDRIYIAGRAEAPILSNGDTLIDGPNESYGFIALIDTQMAVLKVQILTGVARPFDLLSQDDQILAGFSIRDLVRFDGHVVQARIQDLDCLVISWDTELQSSQWHHRLGGVFDKSGVDLVRGRSPGAVMVAGHFIGTIGDNQGLEFQSNGFEPDLFVWEFSRSGQVLYGTTTGGPQSEELKGLLWRGDTLEWLVQFREGFHFFGSSFQTEESGYHLAHLTMGTSGELLNQNVWIGRPDVFGFDLLNKGNRTGILGGYSSEVSDTLGGIFLEKIGTGPVDYFVSFNSVNVNATRFLPPKSFLLYPNPARDILLIRDHEAILEEDVMIFDASGRCVLSTRQNPVDLTFLAPGPYFLRYGGTTALFVRI